MFFHGVTITVSAISDFKKRDQFDVIKGIAGECCSVCLVYVLRVQFVQCTVKEESCLFVNIVCS